MTEQQSQSPESVTKERREKLVALYKLGFAKALDGIDRIYTNQFKRERGSPEMKILVDQFLTTASDIDYLVSYILSQPFDVEINEDDSSNEVVRKQILFQTEQIKRQQEVQFLTARVTQLRDQAFKIKMEWVWGGGGNIF